MNDSSIQQLSRRERQILDILYREKEATAIQVAGHLPNPPGNAAIRKWLSIMEEKGLVGHRKQGRAFVYGPRVPIEEAKTKALRQVVNTYFGGQAAMAAAALLKPSQHSITIDDCQLLLKLIDQAEKEGR